jgi:prophage regulatory protein
MAEAVAAATVPSLEIERLASVKLRTGLSQTTIWRLRRSGEFPKPKKLGRSAIGWLRQDIDAWLNSRASVA